MTIVQEYLELTTKWKREFGEKTLVLMQVGSFFEVYALRGSDGVITGSDIEQFSLINDMVITPKSRMLHDGHIVLMAGFGLAQLDKYVKRLQENDYTILVYTQDIQGKNTTRSLAEVISPGTFFSPDTEESSNTTMCVWLEHVKKNKFISESIVSGISTIDVFTGKTTLYQSVVPYHHNPCSYDDIERLVAIHRPRECIIMSNTERNIVNDIISYVGLDNVKTHVVEKNTSLEKHAKNAEKQIYQHEFFKRFYPQLSEEAVMQAIVQTHGTAVQSFVLLVDFVFQHNQTLTTRLCDPLFENDTNKLQLANHSLKQLNILEDKRHSGKLRSVGSFLNNCVTVMGKRTFIYNLHNPITDCQELTRSYDTTAHILSTGQWKGIRIGLSGVHDLDKLQRKIAMRKVTPRDFASLVEDLKKIMMVAQDLQCDNVLDKYICLEGEPIKYCGELIENITHTFDLDKCNVINDISQEKLSNLTPDKLSFIKPGLSKEVDESLSDSLDSHIQLEAIANKLSSIISTFEKQSKCKTLVKIHETAKSDPILMATKRRTSLLKHHIDGMKPSEKEISVSYKSHTGKTKHKILDLSSIECGSIGSNKKDEVIFNDVIKQLASKVQSSIDELILNITRFYNNYVEDFQRVLSSLEHISLYTNTLDTLQCKAYIADKYNYCKPEIKPNAEKSFCAFTEIRHPLIEHIQTNELYVTNDLTLGEQKSLDGFLLYGTNAVGKTSFIKSVGIAVIMAQAGLYVPCKSFCFSPYSYVFTRILGNDNLFKGLSTFAVEMSELRTILKFADKNSLILGDELCSGTESDSALSIFTAGLQVLHEKRSSFLFATHFHEVTNYDELTSMNKLGFKHMEVNYDAKNDCLVYNRKLKDGPGNTMYGLEVCKSLNLPEEFLQRAHDIRTKYNTSCQSLLSQNGSHFNTRKVRGNCEICLNRPSSEVHHLQHQSKAQKSNGYVDSFHKNHMANLINICSSCHDKIHKVDIEHVIKKTTNGYKICELDS